jgi:hypothetical protein
MPEGGRDDAGAIAKRVSCWLGGGSILCWRHSEYLIRARLSANDGIQCQMARNGRMMGKNGFNLRFDFWVFFSSAREV